MSLVLETACKNVVSSDLYDRGYGEAGIDFIDTARRADNIITNPPYNRAEAFVAKAPPARVWVFSERITFYPKNAEVKGSGTTAYAWFVWDKNAPSGTELKWFKPGYKARYG
jgi:hypothetical protein